MNLVEEIVHSLDAGWFYVYDAEGDLPRGRSSPQMDLVVKYLESTALSLSAIARLMARQDDEVRIKWEESQ